MSALYCWNQYDGAAQAITAGVLRGHIGLLVSIEKTAYAGESAARVTDLLHGWAVKKGERMGSSATKLLIYLHPDLKNVAARKLFLAAKLAEENVEEDMPLLVEHVTYPVESDKAYSNKYAETKPDLVI
ncbi:hypothetical protein ACFLVX_00720 [Chloroflexota bacterium]